MNISTIRSLFLLVFSVAAGLLTGCSGSKNYVVLLPVDDRVSGEVVVSNAHGSQVLNKSWQATEIAGADAVPGKPEVQNRETVLALVGSALTGMPQSPVHFMLYFDNADEFTTDSKRMLPEILKAVKERHPAEMSVVGHTDTLGSSASNYQLGLLRAKSVTTWLTRLGAKPALVEIDSHGESDLLIKTPDNTQEPRNRRIEVTIR